MSSNVDKGSGYVETEWKNGVTPISDDNLNKIEHGIAANSNNITLINTELASLDTRLDTFEYNLITGGDPVKTGRKIDGQDEYVKRISIGTLPSSGEKDVSLGVTINRLIAIEGGAYRSTDGTLFPLPFTSANTSLNMAVWVQNGTAIRISVGSDRSALVGWVDVYYI